MAARSSSSTSVGAGRASGQGAAVGCEWWTRTWLPAALEATRAVWGEPSPVEEVSEARRARRGAGRRSGGMAGGRGSGVCCG